MFCKTCYYSLSNLTEHRCPECGTAFDPNDPATFFPSDWKEPNPWLERVVAFAIPFVFLLLLVAINLLPDDVMRVFVILWLLSLGIFVLNIRRRRPR